ncbi:DNA primase [Luteolibacter luteus]|uniref:DNA primase n=1 Tax=Luteolibacter luteus TaxID=2728835 RepID=A0A858RN38_9BACT|nr:DNA primase [Luteolibacter luteus]QJE97848.1 DNA primase [Luteolibacter luteus]
MPQISRETTEKILAATDIVSVIESYLNLKRAGSVYKALCPFHSEKTPSFQVNPQRQTFKCFGCGKGGDAITFVRDYENLTFLDAVKKLANRAGVTVQEEAYDPKEDRARRQRGRQLDIHREIAAYLHKMLFTKAAQGAREYMKSRGFGKEMAERWMVGWMPDREDIFKDWVRQMKFSGREMVDAGFFVQKERGGIYVRFMDRLMFPIRNDHGDVIGFSGRHIRDDQTGGKYINSPETVVFKKSNVLFALEKARKEIMAQNSVLICEGQLDVICCHEQGISHAVASLGTALTEQHAKLLRRYAKSAVLCYDADKAGMDATEKGFRVLAPEGLPVRVVKMPVGEDPDSYMRKHGPDAFRESLAKAMDFFEFLIDRETGEKGLTDVQSRMACAKKCADLLRLVPDAVMREDMINRVATRLRIGVPELREAVAKEIRFARNKPAARSERVSNAESEPAPFVAEPIALDPVVGYLCSLALHSPAAQERIGEQFEAIHEAADHIEGIPLLEAILSQRPDPGSHVAVNSFISSLPEEQRLALHTDPTFHHDPPENSLGAADEALAHLSAKALYRRDLAIKGQLGRSDLPSDEMFRLLHEAKEVAELLKGLDQRYIYNDRFAPVRKAQKPPFPRGSRSFSKPENNP